MGDENMTNYEWDCPDCKAKWSGSTTGNIEITDEMECPKCGRVSMVVKTLLKITEMKQTSIVKSPTKLQKIEAMDNMPVDEPPDEYDTEGIDHP